MREAKRPPTDYRLLRAIYERHRAEYVSFVKEPRGRRGEDPGPIDIPAIAEDLHTDADSVFGRLYYHLDPLYGPPRPHSTAPRVFFTPVAGDDQNCVNFPLLEAVLAGLWERWRRDLWTLASP